MRGTRIYQLVLARIKGIIPAHAGNTYVHTACGSHLQDHPRACGEHNTGSQLFRPSGGSSPRMRGTLRCLQAACLDERIIPAHAGNTGTQGRTLQQGRDHPRACGEHITISKMPEDRMGSSPRMRGTQTVVYLKDVPTGIIPTHAGNTVFVQLMRGSNRDHPRACGEHFFQPVCTLGQEGSSPRMRGTHFAKLDIKLTPRIIPAHAGNTLVLSALEALQEDHPRACGEHSRTVWQM